MTLSFGEIESLAFKASRGAGLTWGLAAEAGKAVRWLAERGLAGPEVLAAHLPRVAGKDYAMLKPHLDSMHWRPAGEALCPLIAGVTLSDHAGILPNMLTLGPVRNPLLLVPFVDRAANRLGHPLTVDWPDTQFVCATTGLEVHGDPTAETAMAVTISRAGHWPSARRLEGRRAIDPAVTDSLNRFAQRTYVPATEASRLAGAGAGIRDND